MKASETKHSTWPRKRLRFALRKRRSEEDIKKLTSTQEVAFLPMEAISDKGDLDLSITRQKADVENGYTLFFDNDVVVAKITPCFENGKGALVHSLYNGIGYGTTELFVLSPNLELDSKFLFYVTISEEFRLNGEAAMKGAAGQKRVPPDFIQDFKLSIPPLLAQHRIVNYLDRETAEIDALVADKERMLALLEEKRQALISHIATRGLDPNAPLKPSGLPWLGDIPQHWEIRRLKFLSKSLEQGSSPVASNVPAQPDELGVLKLSAISKGKFIKHENKALRESEDLIHSLSLKGGDILITRGNTPKLVGEVCMVPQDEPNLLISDLIYRLRVKNYEILPSFLAFYLLTSQARSQIESDARGSSGSMVKISQGHIFDWYIPLPPKTEQQDIVNTINQEQAKNEDLKNELIKSVSLLKERRSALITAAVTGQICLEEMAA